MSTAELTRAVEIPAEACRFAADVEIASGGSSKTKPVKILARTAREATSWYFGRMVHDMAGMRVDTPTIPLDYCHRDDEVLGFSDTQTPSVEGLEILGKLVPFTDDDRASEVIFKSAEGVPYQASIYFDPFRLVLEDVGAGMTVNVNAGTFTGPGVIAREWYLRGAAICPYGVDPCTTVEFSRRTGPDGQPLTYQPKEPHQMSATATAPAAETTTAEAPKPATPATTETPKPEATTTTTNEAPKPTTTAEAPPAAAATELSTKGPGAKFLEAFGDEGGKWFAQGLSFEEAQAKFAIASREKITQQDAKIAELTTQLSAVRKTMGEKDPVSFEAEAPAEQTAATKLAAKLGNDNIARFAAGIVLPK